MDAAAARATFASGADGLPPDVLLRRTRVPRAALDPTLGAHASVVRGVPARRGAGTPLDEGQQRLAEALTNALDPDGTLV